MTAFRWVALDASGQTLYGTMDAASESEVVEKLQREGRIPMRAEPASGGNFLSALLATEFTRRNRLSSQDTAAVTRELATMLSAGQDLDRALRFSVETAPNERVRAVMERVRTKVRGGSPLAAALAQEPESFSRLYIGLVRAGEAGGSLGDTLARLAVLLDRERSLALTIQSALTYPALLFIVSVGSVWLLLTQVLPQFVPLFEQNGAELPLPTKLLIALGAGVTVAGPWLLILALVVFLGVRQWLKEPANRTMWDGALLRLPLVGGLVKETIAARFCRTLGTLLKNGVPLIAALGIVRDALGNLAAVKAVEAATLTTKGGTGLSRALAVSGVFPIRTIHLLSLGEETARLADMSLQAADIHEEGVRHAIQRLVGLLVPVVTLVMGAVVAGIIGALLMAMLSLNDLAG